MSPTEQWFLPFSVDSSMVERRPQAVDGGSNPTSTLHKKDWIVHPANIDQARAIVRSEHYSGGASNTGIIHGLYRAKPLALCGVAWWIPPTRTCAAAWWSKPEEVLSLSRLAILPEVPKNGCTFLLARSVRILPPQWRCLITYADTWQGHTGAIYRAAGWEYMGLTKPERTYVKDGRMLARKAGPRTRTHAEMLELGAKCIGSFARHRFRLIRKTTEQ